MSSVSPISNKLKSRNKNSGANLKSMAIETMEKLDNLSGYIKEAKEMFKIASKAQENLTAALKSIYNVHGEIARNLQRNRPQSALASCIDTPMALIVQSNADRYKLVYMYQLNEIEQFEMFYKKIMRSCKNHMKRFEKEDKDRSQAFKKTGTLKKSKSTHNINKLPVEDNVKALNDQAFNIKSSREDALRKLMIDENIIYSSLLEMNVNMVKAELFHHDKYSLANVRNVLSSMNHLLKNKRFLPPECERMIKNQNDFGTRKMIVSFHSNTSNQDQDELKDDQLLPSTNQKLDYSIIKALKTATVYRRVALHNYISIETTEMDLVKNDIIICITDISNGWQCGVNLQTNLVGWFPVSFTEKTESEESLDAMKKFIEEQTSSTNSVN